MGDPYNICKGIATIILSSDNLEAMTDIHLIVDGLVPTTYGRPIWFEKGGFDLNNCNCIVGDDATATMAHVRRILGQFSDISKSAEEQYHTSNQREKSKAVVSVSMHFIIVFTHNPSIHIYLFISLFLAFYPSCT